MTAKLSGEMLYSPAMRAENEKIAAPNQAFMCAAYAHPVAGSQEKFSNVAYQGGTRDPMGVLLCMLYLLRPINDVQIQ